MRERVCVPLRSLHMKFQALQGNSRPCLMESGSIIFFIYFQLNVIIPNSADVFFLLGIFMCLGCCIGDYSVHAYSAIIIPYI